MRTATRPTKWTLRRRLRPSLWLLAASKYLMVLHRQTIHLDCDFVPRLNLTNTDYVRARACLQVHKVFLGIEERSATMVTHLHEADLKTGSGCPFF